MMKNPLRAARDFYNEKYKRDQLTQTELARRAGVSRETVIQLEKGTTMPRVDLAIKLRRILKVRSVETLFVVPME
ncbi:MAG: helix-turn-helix domain-containing protein [Bdellovibrionales bacterium]|nr:helix-turn-helix domain-containing protein [Bdellovibrionales bacterium]